MGKDYEGCWNGCGCHGCVYLIMTTPELVGTVIGLFAISGTGISIGTWIGLRRAESKRIVKAEIGLAELREAMRKFEEHINSEMKEYLVGADSRYARKDVIEERLLTLKEKQVEIAQDVKEIKRKLEGK